MEFFIDPQQAWSVSAKIFGFLLGLGVWLGILGHFLPLVGKKIESAQATYFKPILWRDYLLLGPSRQANIVLGLLSMLHWGLALLGIYLCGNFIFSELPWQWAQTASNTIDNLLLFVFYAVVFVGLIQFASLLFSALERRAKIFGPSIIRLLTLGHVELLFEEKILSLIILLLRLTRIFAQVFLLYFFLTVSFSLFQFSRDWAQNLIEYFVTPLYKMFKAVVLYLPKLFSIVVIVLATRYAIKFLKFLFREIGRGNISIKGFHLEWVEPTYKILRFLILVFAAIVIFPYLPGAQSPFFKGISIFVGILFSLGSGSAVSNLIAGVVLTYTRAFQLSDRVQIGETTGDVVEVSLLATRLKTIKNVIVTIPNSMVLGSHLLNFSTSAKENGLLLHSTVTIGYDAPWKKVHELLQNAAQATTGIALTPAPFVLQTALDDFYVHYEINAYTHEPHQMAKIYSELHQNIQDQFNAAGIEIMSPAYHALRDGNLRAMPKKES